MIKKVGQFLLRLLPPLKFRSSSGSKKVLICYSKKVAFNFKKLFHSNYHEIKIIINTFLENGYSVDVVDYNSIYTPNYFKYDIIFGFGDVFEKAFYKKRKATMIHYATGACSLFQDISEAIRIDDFYQRTGVRVKPRRMVGKTWPCSVILSDFIFCLGNDWTVSTFPKRNNIFKLPATSLGYWKNTMLNRDWNVAKKNFLFFGGCGAVHKGLDLFLEAAKKVGEECEFHVCGKLEGEKDFYDYYQQHYGDIKNIFYHGYLDVKSLEFKSLISRCGFVVLPSCSEGMATSVLTCMYSGLIPIVTRQCGIEIHNFGFMLENENLSDSLFITLKEAGNLSDVFLHELSMMSYESVKDHHSIGMFERVFSDLFNKVIFKEIET